MGPSVSVLVGDYWLVKAMELILDAEDDNVSAVMRIFAKTLSDLAEGEMLQLQKAQSGKPCESDYLRIIYNKTASLFEATCVSAAMSVGASDQMIEAARSYAVALGLAFQIQDDILDVIGNEEVLGKPIGSDAKNDKLTYVSLKGLQTAKEDVAKLSNEAISMIKFYEEDNHFLSELTTYLIDREK